MAVSRRKGQVTHVLLTRSPLIHPQQKPGASPFDLHVLSTPPAFVLSQDQTLQTKTNQTPHNAAFQSIKPRKQENQAQPKPPPNKQQPRPNKNTTQPNQPSKNQANPATQCQPTTPNQNRSSTMSQNNDINKHDTLSSSQTTHPPQETTHKSESQPPRGAEETVQNGAPRIKPETGDPDLAPPVQFQPVGPRMTPVPRLAEE